jgi:hypothetical protein
MTKPATATPSGLRPTATITRAKLSPARLAALLAMVSSLGVAPPPVAAAPVPATAAATSPATTTALTPRQPALQTPWFRLFSDFRFDLYDAVLTAATALRKKEADPLHGACFDRLSREERSAWDAAVAYYAQTVAASDDFSRERLVVRATLAGYGPRLDDDDRRGLALALLFLDAGAN